MMFQENQQRILDAMGTGLSQPSLNERAHEALRAKAIRDFDARQAQARVRERYVANTSCIKCGEFTRHTTNYRVDDVADPKDGTYWHDEYMRRQCGMCGYVWREKCADTK